MKTNRILGLIGIAAITVCFVNCKKSTPPTVKIYDNAISVSYTSANVTGEVTDEGSSPVTDRGLVYGKQGEARQDTMYCGNGGGEFPTRLTNLEPNTMYNCMAFARNSAGMAFSGKATFTTLSIAQSEVATYEPTSVTHTHATCGGNVVSDGGSEVTERGVCWATTPNPTTSGSHLASGSGTGDFSVTLSGLTANTTYHVRAYAMNEKGTAYGEDVTFRTEAYSIPAVVTGEITNITTTSATCSGNVTSNGGLTVTARGICWSRTNHNPTISDNHTTEETGTGDFISNITGLTPNTIYYVRAYATNDKGTGYGEMRMLSSASSFIVNFENGIPAGWTTIDADGDGYTWVSSKTPGNYHNSGVDLTGTGHNNSNAYVISGSWINQPGQALTPNNFLVSPKVTIVTGSTFSFYACAQDPSYPADHFGVAISNNGTSDWIMVNEWTMTAKNGGGAITYGRNGNNRYQGNWYRYTADLSAFAGQKYIAIRHFNCTDQFILNVDDIELTCGAKTNNPDNIY